MSIFRSVEQSVVDHGVPIEQRSIDLRFASAVAELGLLLRDSQHKNQADYGALIRRAKGARGEDRHGYRAGFLQLAKDAQVLAAGLVP
jgi:Ca-activated chloride channel family protein